MRPIEMERGFKTYIPYSKVLVGAAVVKHAAAASTVDMVSSDATENILGFAKDDPVQHRVDGFYSPASGALTPEMVPVVVQGKCRVWVTPTTAGTVSNTNIDMGDYLEISSIGGATNEGHGMLEEAGSAAGETKTAISVAKALENCKMGSGLYQYVASGVSVGDLTVTMTTGYIALMGLAVGDPILLVDVGDKVQVNRVAALSDTVITLQFAATVALAGSSTDYIVKPMQVEALII